MRLRIGLLGVIVAAGSVGGCRSLDFLTPEVASDAGTDARVADAGETDADRVEAGRKDATVRETGSPDAGSPDAGSLDARATDAGTRDAGDATVDAMATRDAPSDQSTDAPLDRGVDAPTVLPTCTGDDILCGGTCIDPLSDATSCGACGTVCGGATVCAAGYCATPYYIAPGGHDSSPGTLAAPWGTFAYATQQLLPGDALLLLDGTYVRATTGYPIVTCQSGAVKNGAPGAPIVLTALHPRQAILASDGASEAASVSYCANWVLDGLTATTVDLSPDAGGSANPTVFVQNASAIQLSRLLVAHNNRYFASDALRVLTVAGALITDTEVYDFAYRGLVVINDSNAEVRRAYTNSRGASDIDGGAVTMPATEGDQGIVVRPPAAVEDVTLVENSISESVAIGFIAGIYESEQTTSGGSLILGSIARTTMQGVSVELTTTTGPVAVRDFVAVDAINQGILAFGGTSAQLSGISLLETRGITVGAPGVGTVTNTDSYSGVGTGFIVNPPDAGPSTWTVSYGNAAGNPVEYSPSLDAGPFTHCTEIGATGLGTGPGQCVAYVPEASPMKHAGVDGGDIGANIIYTLADGGLTSTKLWAADGGAFPCGAVVPGINDVDGGSCANVHHRLNFVPGGCPVP